MRRAFPLFVCEGRGALLERTTPFRNANAGGGMIYPDAGALLAWTRGRRTSGARWTRDHPRWTRDHRWIDPTTLDRTTPDRTAEATSTATTTTTSTVRTM
eukprot:4849998-Pyramimonas_sp.AAC.1